MSGAAVWAVARSQLRRRGAALLVLSLFAGVIGGAVTGALVVAHRTATAYDRLADRTNLDDARALIFADDVDVDEIAAWPGVEKVWPSRQLIGGVVDAPVAFMAVSTGPSRPDDLFTPVLLEGRAPRDHAPFEVMVPEVLAEEAGLRVGETIPLKLLTPEEVTQFDTGFGEPDGPRVDLTVVGIMRAARQWVELGIGPLIGSPALGERMDGYLVGHSVLLRLEDGPAGVPEVRRRFERLEATTAPSGAAAEFGVLEATYPTSTQDPEITTAITTLVSGQTVFLVVALVAGLVALGQALGRHHAVDVADQRIEAALGLTRGERVLARSVPAALGGILAGCLALAGGLLAGRVEPLGALRAYEPDPGWWLDWTVVTAGAVLTAAAFVTLAAVTAARVVRPAHLTDRVEPPVKLTWLGRRAPLVAGLGFALRGGRGRSAVPVRATLGVVALGLAGVVAVASFATSLDRLKNDPARYGWVADFAIIDSQPQDLADLARDDRIEAIVDVAATHLLLEGRRLNGLTARELKGDLPLTLVDGRLPARDDEVALSVRDAERFGVGLGSELTLSLADGSRRTLRLVGLVVNPFGNASTGDVFLSGRTFEAARRSAAFTQALIKVEGGVEVEALYAELAATREMQRAAPPAAVRHLSQLGRLPLLLGLFLALLVVVVLAHALVLTVRRRAAELAVLRVIGLTPRQVGTALVVMAATVAGAGLVMGTALGLAVGRVVWGEVARSIGVAGDLAVPWVLLLVAVPAVLLGTALLALLPARRAARLRPAAVLHAE